MFLHLLGELHSLVDLTGVINPTAPKLLTAVAFDSMGVAYFTESYEGVVCAVKPTDPTLPARVHLQTEMLQAPNGGGESQHLGVTAIEFLAVNCTEYLIVCTFGNPQNGSDPGLFLITVSEPAVIRPIRISGSLGPRVAGLNGLVFNAQYRVLVGSLWTYRDHLCRLNTRWCRVQRRLCALHIWSLSYRPRRPAAH